MSKTKNIILWVIQVLLAGLFIFSGVAKLMMPIEALTSQIPLPGIFIQCISVLEILGGLGLFLPGIFKIYKILTPLAAIGLLIIMIGAVVVTVATMGISSAILPFVVGILCVFVAKERFKR